MFIYRKSGRKATKKIYAGKVKQESCFIVIRMMFNKIIFDIILTPRVSERYN